MSEKSKRQKSSPAAKFMIAIVVVIVLVLAGSVWLNTNEETAMRIAFVPSHTFATEEAEDQLDYTKDASWFALPGKESYALMTPEGVETEATQPQVDVFFLHPTTYITRGNWNAPLDDEETNNRAREFTLKNQASTFNLAGQIYAPRYRQAAFGAFFDVSGDGIKAMIRAYGDVLVAFDNFLARRNPEHGILLAGHSQGSLHLIRLLKDRFDGTELTSKLVAAYIIGMPVSVESDIGAVSGVEACADSLQTGCVLSFQSFGSDGDGSKITTIFNATPGLNGQLKAGTQMLCSNPLDWSLGGTADKLANSGAVMLTRGDKKLGATLNDFTGAMCGEDGILYLKDTPGGDDWNQYTMSGGNYHVYDYNLFYMNIRENARKRAEAWSLNEPGV